jgi:hypothetical protein
MDESDKAVAGVAAPRLERNNHCRECAPLSSPGPNLKAR